MPPNFAVRDVSDKTAESISPNFPLRTILTKRPNFALADISRQRAESIPPNFALRTFPPKQPNQSRRISAEFRTQGCFRRNGRTSAKFCPRGRFQRNGRISTEFCTRGRFRRNGRISAQFCTRGRFRRNGRINPAEFPLNFTPEDVSDETADFRPNFVLFSLSDDSDNNSFDLSLSFVLSTSVLSICESFISVLLLVS
ncbi:MAG: hypothetical protein Q8881_04345 [Sweet potato little leaf phytoplasma]|nr:hypothetical protein [Sweet potato little leaf phytoplasma]